MIHIRWNVASLEPMQNERRRQPHGRPEANLTLTGSNSGNKVPVGFKVAGDAYPVEVFVPPA